MVKNNKLNQVRIYLGHVCSDLDQIVLRLNRAEKDIQYFNRLAIRLCEDFNELIRAMQQPSPDNYYTTLFGRKPDLSKTNVFRAHLKAIDSYLAELSVRIKAMGDVDFHDEVDFLFFDMLPLLNGIKKMYNIIDIKPSSSGNRTLKTAAKSALGNARLLFGQVLSNNVRFPYFLTGLSIFSLRQTIELAGREILGIESINDIAGNHIRKSMLSWEFLKSYSGPSIQISFSMDDIYTVYTWSNSYIHTGEHSRHYVNFVAIQIVQLIFQYDTIRIVDPEGEIDNRAISRIKINDYRSLKLEFQAFLDNKRIPFGKGQYITVWNNNPAADVRG